MLDAVLSRATELAGIPAGRNAAESGLRPEA
jgi:hypothetical protein